MKISNSWLKMSSIYEIFARSSENLVFSEKVLDFSEEAKEEMYIYESKGIGNLEENLFCNLKNLNNKINGYYYGKKMLNITISMWKEDIKKGFLFIGELYNDSKFPHWWLDNIFHLKENQHKNFIGFNK